MARWPHDDPASLAAFYGDPDKGEPGRQLVPVTPPFNMYYDAKPVAHIMFHKKAAPALQAALAAIWEHYGRDQAKVDAARISHYSGSYNPRMIRGSATRWSNHAYGAAIDFDAEHNGFNTGHGTMPQAVVDCFKAQGALWGGDYHGRTDPMHFEFCSREQLTKPVGIMDAPDSNVQADGDGDDGAPDEATPAEPTGVPAGSTGGFFGRARNWIVAGASSIGFGGLGALTDWQIAAVLFAFVFISVVCTVSFIILFFGAGPVRDFVRRHVT